MAIPDFEKLMLPLLEIAGDEKVHSVNEAEEKIVKKFSITKSERNQLKSSGGETTLFNRIRWARLYLKKAGLIYDPKLAHYKITKDGLKILDQNLKHINTRFLLNFPKFMKWYTKLQSVKKIHVKRRKELQEKFGIIVLLDALGMKGIWKRKDSKEVLERWNQFVNFFESLVKEYIRAKTTFNAFSDTIIITVVSNSNKILLDLADLLRFQLIRSLVIGMPLRGCITVGKFYQDGRLIIGDGLDEAAQYFELPQWIGVSASPSTHRIIEKFKAKERKGLEHVFFKCDIPLKGSIEKDGWAINWPELTDMFVPKFSREVGKKYDDALKIIIENLDSTSEIESTMKWRNTLKFYEQALKEHK